MKDVISGLNLILDTYKGNPDFAAEHDQIFAGPDDIDDDQETDSIRKEMGSYGWFICPEFNCWSKFV